MRPGEAKERKKERSECNCEDREADKGGLWNVKVILSYVFKDACFPLHCHDRIKIKASSSDIKLPIGQIFYQFTL